MTESVAFVLRDAYFQNAELHFRRANEWRVAAWLLASISLALLFAIH